MDSNSLALIVIAALAAYLIGGIPFGWLVGRLVRGIDIREHGSRNLGATNVGRVVGVGWGALVLVLDALKGALPVALLTPWLARLAFAPERSAQIAVIATGLAAIIGHLAPVALGFRGGKGVATSAGVCFALAPSASLAALAVFLFAVALSRMVSLGSVLAAVTLPLAYATFPPPGSTIPDAVFLLCVTAGVLVLIRHRSNLQRILQGTEPRIGRSTR